MDQQACDDRRHILIVVQYDGTDYAGFQRQPEVPTIQGELEKALTDLFGEPTHIKAASRTDAGVHALGQVATFFTTSPLPVERLPRVLNDALPPPIAVVQAREVAEDFHPRFNAVGKRYTYRLFCRSVRSPFVCRYAWHVPHRLDLQAMREAGRALVGEHDFAAFCAAGSSVRSTVRTLRRLDLEGAGDVVELHFEADGFLYMMVRIIVGTLVEVGLGRLEAQAVAEVLASRDRAKAGPTAPPQGLCLVRVEY